MDFQELIITPFQEFLINGATYLPKLILLYLIWVFGKYGIDLLVELIKKINLGGKLDDKAKEILIKIFVPTAKILLILVILDSLGIGSTVIQTLLGSISLGLAIMLGLSFGEAFKPYAKNLVDRFAEEVK